MTDMAAVQRETVVSKAPAALFNFLIYLMLAMLVSCGVSGGQIGTGEAEASKETARATLPALKPGRAVLVEGSMPVKGLPGFGRNALSALYGKYALAQGDATPKLEIEVWFSREILVIPASWGKSPCRTQPVGFTMLASPAEADGSMLLSLAGSEYTLFVRIPSGMTEPCAFIAVFADRFSFFYRYAARPEDVSFPALLDL